MSVSGISAGAENDHDKYERSSWAGGARQASVEDPLLVELARKLAPVRRSSQAQAVSEPDQWDAMQPLEAAQQSTIAFALRKPSGTASLHVERRHASGFGVPYSRDPHGARPATGRRPGGWTLKASALAPAGAALISAALVIAVFGPKGGPSGAPKAPPFIAAGHGPTELLQPSGETVAPRGDVDAARLKAVAQSSPAKVVRSEERPTDPDADASPAAAPPSARSAPPPVGVAQPTAGTSAGPPVAAPATSVAAAEIAAPPPAAPQSPDFNAVRPASAPPEATEAPSAADAGEAAPRDAPQRPANPAPIAESKVVATARPMTPKPALPANFARRTSARVMVAETGATAPGAAAETRIQPDRPGASTPAEPQATPAPAAAQEPVNPWTHAFGALAGALLAPAADERAWAVQFAAPKSEAEAEAAAARLNAKYDPALHGATIGVHKTLVHGETIYALRVAGLSKEEAAALCVRVRGRDCSIVK